MTRNDLNNRYFKWLFDLVHDEGYPEQISYKKLLMHLHSIDFRYQILMDRNRASDGADLRYRFALTHNYCGPIEDILGALDRPCTVLEMIVALAIRCEEDYMDDPRIGDRTQQWFWEMLVNLGLGPMTDAKFDKEFVNNAINRFLDREYEPDGRGGLFTVRECDTDLRNIDIWTQMCWYLDNII